MKKLGVVVAALLLTMGFSSVHAYAEEGGSEAPKVTYVKLDPLTLPVIDKSGIVQIINVSVTLEVADDLVAKEVEMVTPRLKDAYIQEMYGTLSRKGALTAEGVLQVNAIKERLSKVTMRVLGADKVKDVLLQSVNQRRA
ncbi:MAG: flagellar basal body-associated FliL family protein [Pseudobdellovibrionaceae bacterium]